MRHPDIKQFDFTENEVEAFTEGDCWELARNISLLFGYPVVTSTSKSDGLAWYHAANRLPDGTIVDIEGIWSEYQWIANWGIRSDNDFQRGILVAKEWTYKEFLNEIKEEEFELQYYQSKSADEYARNVIALAFIDVAA